MSVIHERMPVGIPGDVSRKSGAVIEPAVTGAALPFGAPVQLDAEGRLIRATDADAPVYGFLVRPFPAQSFAEGDNALGAGGAKAGNVADVLRCGYMTVRLSSAEGAATAKGAPVKVVFAAEGGFNAGEIAASRGTIMPGCFFMGTADGSGNVEISFNI